MTREELLARHHLIVTGEGGLMDLRRELGQVRGAERDAKVRAYQMNQQVTDRQRDHIASANALEQTKSVWQIEADIAALEEERDDIRIQLAHMNGTG